VLQDAFYLCGHVPLYIVSCSWVFLVKGFIWKFGFIVSILFIYCVLCVLAISVFLFLLPAREWCVD